MPNVLTGRNRVLKALQGEPVDRLPVLCVNQTATYEQMEILGAAWPEANSEAEKMAELAAGSHLILGFDAVRLPFCQTIEAEAMGCVLKKGGRMNLPSVQKHPYNIDANEVSVPDDFLRLGRIPQLLEGIRLLKARVGTTALVIGGIIGPYSTAGNLLGTEELLRKSFRQPEKLANFLAAGTQIGLALAKAEIAAGADVICIEDMLASLGLVSPNIFREVILPWHNHLVPAIGSVPVIMHICGALDEVLGDVADTGVDAISVEDKVNAKAAVAKLTAKNHPVALIGGVSALQSLYAGTAEQVKTAVHQAAEAGYRMIAPSCAIAPATSLINLRAMVSAAEETTAGSGANRKE